MYWLDHKRKSFYWDDVIFIVYVNNGILGSSDNQLLYVWPQLVTQSLYIKNFL